MVSMGRPLKGLVAILLVLAVLFALTAVGRAEPAPGVAWEKTYDIQGSDRGWSMQPTTDGYILAGTANDQVCLAKIDAAGNVQWKNTYSFGDRSKGYSVRQATDGGYVVTGSVRQGSKDQILLMKADKNGTQLWNKTYGSAAAGDVEGAGTSVMTVPDGGYLIAAQYLNPMTKNIGIQLLKTDASGTIQNTQMIGKNGDISSPSVEQTSDGGHIIAATLHLKNTPDDYDIYLVKFDPSGGTQWEKTIGGTGYQYGGHDGSIRQASDGGFILVGENGGAYLAKTDASGNLQWGKQYNNSTRANSVVLTADGGYALGGVAGDGKLLVLKTSSTGDELWRETAGTGACEALSLRATGDGGYAAFGTAGEDLCFVKLNPPAPSPTPTPAAKKSSHTDMGLLSGFGDLFGYGTGVDEGRTDTAAGNSLFHGSLFGSPSFMSLNSMNDKATTQYIPSRFSISMPAFGLGSAGSKTGGSWITMPFNKAEWPFN